MAHIIQPIMMSLAFGSPPAPMCIAHGASGYTNAYSPWRTSSGLYTGVFGSFTPVLGEYTDQWILSPVASAPFASLDSVFRIGVCCVNSVTLSISASEAAPGPTYYSVNTTVQMPLGGPGWVPIDYFYAPSLVTRTVVIPITPSPCGSVIDLFITSKNVNLTISVEDVT